MNTLENITREFLAECHDDYVGVWSLLKRVRTALPEESSSKQRDATLSILKRLLEEGRIMVGNLTDADGFQPWKLNPAEAIERIKREWLQLGHDPDIGDIAWLTAPIFESK